MELNASRRSTTVMATCAFADHVLEFERRDPLDLAEYLSTGISGGRRSQGDATYPGQEVAPV